MTDRERDLGWLLEDLLGALALVAAGANRADAADRIEAAGREIADRVRAGEDVDGLPMKQILRAYRRSS